MSCRWPRDSEASRPRFSPSSASSVWFFVRSSSTMPFGRAEVLAGCDEHGRGGHREHEDPQESQALVGEHDAGGQNAVDHVMRCEPGGGLPEDGQRTSLLGDGRRGDDEGDVDHVVGETCQRSDAEQREPADAVPGGRVQERAPRNAGQGVRRRCCTPCRS